MGSRSPPAGGRGPQSGPTQGSFKKPARWVENSHEQTKRPLLGISHPVQCQGGRLQAVCQQGRGEQQNQQKMGRARCLGTLREERVSAKGSGGVVEIGQPRRDLWKKASQGERRTQKEKPRKSRRVERAVSQRKLWRRTMSQRNQKWMLQS